MSLAKTYGMRGIELVRGSGALVYDLEGNEYVDCTAGVGVVLLGHAHPELTRAISEQTQRLVTCYGIFDNDVRNEFARRFEAVTPGNLNTFFLSNSGSESVECALKLVRRYTGRTEVVAMSRAFHGRTLGALSAIWKPAYRKAFEPLVPGFSHVKYGDSEGLRNVVSESTAAVIVEPVQGEAGVVLPPEGYLQEVREICNESGALLIFDEVQSFGRTGNYFAAQTFGVTPDIACVAKGVAGGVPMGVTASTEEIFSALGVGEHGSTFGGNPLSCAAGIATLNVLQSENLIERGAEMGQRLLAGLRKIENESIREVRGIGAMVALEARFPCGGALKSCMENGVLVLASGRNVMRFLPPLVISEEQVDTVIEVVRSSLNANSTA
ncbi:MAG: acetylornithine/succinylornithine family transaminase [archaeon]